MPLENGASRASRLRVTLVACFSFLAVASIASAQQPTQEPVSEAPTIPPGPLDPTRPVVPTPPVATPTPAAPGVSPTVIVPPPMVPSAQRPDLFLPVVTEAIPGAFLRPRFGASISEEYSDNFFLTTDKRRSNFRSLLAPSIGLDINGAFTKGLLAYTLAAAHDTVPSSEEVRIFHAFVGNVIWQATPLLTLTVSDTLTRSDEPDQADRLSLRRDRQPFLSNTLSAAATYQLGRVTTGANYGFSTFSSGNQADTTSHTFGANAGTSFYETNTVNLAYLYLLSNTTGERSGTGGSSRDEEITGHSFTATYTRQLTTLMAAGVTGTYSIRNSDASQNSTSSSVGSGIANGTDYNSWSIALFNSYATPRLTMAGSIGYSQIEPSHGSSSSSVTTTSSISYRFGRAIASLSVDSGFSETFVDGQVGSPGTELEFAL